MADAGEQISRFTPSIPTTACASTTTPGPCRSSSTRRTSMAVCIPRPSLTQSPRPLTHRSSGHQPTGGRPDGGFRHVARRSREARRQPSRPARRARCPLGRHVPRARVRVHPVARCSRRAPRAAVPADARPVREPTQHAEPPPREDCEAPSEDPAVAGCRGRPGGDDGCRAGAAAAR